MPPQHPAPIADSRYTRQQNLEWLMATAVARWPRFLPRALHHRLAAQGHQLLAKPVQGVSLSSSISALPFRGLPAYRKYMSSARSARHVSGRMRRRSRSASDVEQSLGSSARNRRDYPPQIAPTVIPRPSAIRDRAWSPTATGSRRSGRHVRPAKVFSEFAIVPGPPTIDAGPSVSSFSASLSRLLMAFLEGTRSDVGSSALARFGISRIVYSHFN